MLTENTDSSADTQSKIRSASTLATGLLLPNLEVQRICTELAHKFRNRVYDPAVTVWLFIMQVLHGPQAARHQIRTQRKRC